MRGNYVFVDAGGVGSRDRVRSKGVAVTLTMRPLMREWTFARSVISCVVLSLAIGLGLGRAQNEAPSPVIGAMKAELHRSIDTFKAQPTPPYFMSYEITDDHTIAVNASFGKIVSSSEDRRRQLDIDLRVGDYHLDNTHTIRG